MRLRRFSRSSFALVTVVMVVAALVAPLTGTALAHTDNEHDLELDPDVESNSVGTTHTLTATLDAAAPTGGEEIDFEVESGPAVRVGCANQPNGTCTGGTTSNDGNSPGSPDLTCTIAAAATSCTVTFTSDASGTNLIRGWVDDDKNNATLDFDAAEGRSSSDTPGDRTEDDDTDVVDKTWFGGLPANTVVDCSPEVASNPATGNGSSETYTCQLYDNKGTAATTDDTTLGQNQVAIDAENLNGANDPDNSAAAGTADFNNFCTTGGNGSCSGTIAASESQAGDALLCFWVDPDGDTAFDPAGATNDGGLCDEADELTGSATATATTIGTTERDDTTDVVRKTWIAAGVPTSIDCSPETDQNVRGTTHTVTCVVVDAFGDTVGGANVDFDVSGRNTASQNNSTTNNQGQVSFTYTDSNAALTVEGQADTIRGCIDADATAGCGTLTGAVVDSLRKFWFSALPTTASIVLDMRNDGGTDNCEATQTAAESSDTNNISETAGHRMCATAFNASGVVIPGEPVTFTISGPGAFFNDIDNDGTKDAGEAQITGTTLTVNTDDVGHAFASIFSTQTGTTSVTASADGASDTGTKVWTVAAADVRNINCTPDTDTNPTGTSHIVTCTVVDRFGNVVPGVTVSATESGPGRFATAASMVTDANGQVEFVVSTIAGETGTQTITGTISAPRGGGAADDPCEQPAGTPAGATAGNCSDTVTKVWEAPPTQCSDGIDNDGDGFVDFPDDPFCESAADDDESPRNDLVEVGPCRGFAPGSQTPHPFGGLVIVGTAGNDLLTGTDGDDIICGLEGDDVIVGGGGDDLIVGNDGNDSIKGNGGKDSISGGAGDDTIDGNRRNDVVRGGAGNDTLRGNRGRDTVRGGSENDTLQGGRGDDILRGGAGDDTLKGFTGDDALNGGTGIDTCRPGPGNDSVRNCEN